MTDIIVGRQQILNHKLDIYAYELLFRGTGFDLNDPEQGAKATDQIITDSLLEIGLSNIVGSHKAFINFTTHNILAKTPLNLPKERIVVEILESTVVTDEVIANVREFARQGYMIALDDFVFLKQWKPLIEVADIIKIDVMAMSLNQIETMISKLSSYNVKFLAEKVETHEEFKALQQLGCVFFQGYFFSKPNLVAGKRLGVSQLAALKLMAAINKANIEFKELTEVISHNVDLSYKLLRYLNSSFFGLPQKIQSIQHAVTCLGMVELRRWSNIMTLASLSTKSVAILENSLVCARMCEQIAVLINANAEQFFMVGILAHIDSLLDMTLEEALEQLPLETSIYEALLHKQGQAGEVLKIALDFETWQLSGEPFANISEEQLGEIYLEAVNWTKQTLNSLT